MRSLVLLLAVCMVACAAPEAHYAKTLRPCDLLATAMADQILGTEGKLGAPEAKDSFLAPYAANVYCTWSYKWEYEQPASGGLRPSKRSLSIDLVVFGDAAEAAKSLSEEHQSGQRTAAVGEQSIRWLDRFDWTRAYLKFRRSNATVAVAVSGVDVDSTALGHSLPDRRLEGMVDQAARAIDQRLLTLRR
jgi:hypothetical protein